MDVSPGDVKTYHSSFFIPAVSKFPQKVLVKFHLIYGDWEF